MVKKVKQILKNPSISYTLMAVISSGINFFSLIVFGRVFSVEDYGAVTTVQALVANIAVLMTPLQIMICKTMAEDSINIDNTINSIVNIVVLINSVLIALLIVVGRAISSYLHFTESIEYIAFVFLVLSNNLYIVITGIVQGKQDFLLLGWSGIILYTIRLVIGVFLGIVGVGPTAVVLGYLVAEILCIGIIGIKLKRIISRKTFDCRYRIEKDTIMWYGVTFVLYMVVSLYMNNGDILIGNLYCDQSEIGLYSVAMNLSKISVFLIATPVATIILPKVAACKGDRRRQKKILIKAEFLTFIISVIYGSFLIFLSDWIINLLYGYSYAGANDYVVRCVVFSTILGLFWVFYQYAFATDLLKLFTIVTLVVGVIELWIIIELRIGMNLIPIVMVVGMILTMCLSTIIHEIKRNVADKWKMNN